MVPVSVDADTGAYRETAEKSLYAEEETVFIEDDFQYHILTRNGSTGTAALNRVMGKHLEDEVLRLPDSVAHEGVTYTVTELRANGTYGIFARYSTEHPDYYEQLENAQCRELVLPRTLTDTKETRKTLAQSHSGLAELEKVTVEAGNRDFEALEGVLYSAGRKHALFYPASYPAETLILPDGVTLVGEGFVCGAYNLRYVVFPNSLTRIEPAGFEWTGLEEVLLPDSVQSIGNGGFYCCHNLKKIKISSSMTQLAQNLFAGADSLEEVEIPASIKTIKPEEFSGCSSLKEVVIPGNVEKMHDLAFRDCDSLEKVTFLGDMKESEGTVFYHCRNIKTVVYGLGVTEFAYYFYHNDRITDFEIGPYNPTPLLESMVIAPSVKKIAAGERPEEWYFNSFTVICGEPGSFAEELAAQVKVPFKALTYGDAPFTDIYFHWGRDAALWAYQNNAMLGVTETRFAPEQGMTREMFVTVLGRLAEQDGMEIPQMASGFEDVKAGEYYEKYLAWGEENGLVAGLSKTEFGVGKQVTREQAATFLVRFAKIMGTPLAGQGDKSLAAYQDSGKVSPWAKDAGVISGYTEGSAMLLKPQRAITRAEAATMLSNFESAVQ